MNNKPYAKPSIKAHAINGTESILASTGEQAKGTSMPISDETAETYFSKGNNSAWDDEK